jgi:succinyl-diaminopimelate desuccinylase
MGLDKSGGGLLERAAELVAIPSVSGNEDAIAGYVYDYLDSWSRSITDRAGQVELLRIDNNVVLRTTRETGVGVGSGGVEGAGVSGGSVLGGGKSENNAERVIFASHLDTVPPVADWRVKKDADTLQGLGAVDTKGSVAVMLELALSSLVIPINTTFIFYSCEEITREENGLRHVLASNPELLRGDIAIVGEPTAGIVEAGCQTTLTARIDVSGKRAHTARPWMGKNAIHLAAEVVDRVAGYGENVVEIDGCTFREQLQVVMIHGGVATNVVPDSASITINHRAAPNRSRKEIEGWLDGYLLADTEGTIEMLDYAQGAMPLLENKWMRKLAGMISAHPRAKLGWTDVATFSEVGTPACNFGPGDPELAHTPYEQVTAGELERVYSVLAALVSG